MAGISKALVVYKVYQTMFRIVKESETVDSRQHCFLLQSSGHEPRYLSVETRQELLRIENSWNAAIVTSVIKLGVGLHLYLIPPLSNYMLIFPSVRPLPCRIMEKVVDSRWTGKLVFH